MAIALLAQGVFPAPALAQQACGPREAVIAQLARRYGEVRRGGGPAGPVAIFELWASEATGSWTILNTAPNGIACVVLSGQNWRDEARPLTPNGRLAARPFPRLPGQPPVPLPGRTWPGVPGPATGAAGTPGVFRPRGGA